MDDRERLRDRARGCLLGGALGDALGAPVEFLNLDLIRRRYPRGVELDDPGLITDDTQMTLFTADGVIRTALHGGDLRDRLWAAYQRWLRTQGPVDPFPETDDWLLGHRGLWASRAPGVTCVSALRGRPGRTDAPVNDSKGCGGLMRAAPAGFLPDPQAAYRAGCDLAALTHGHPSGWIAGGALALLVHLLAVRDTPLTVALLEVEHRVTAEPRGGEVRDALAAAVDAARRTPGEHATLATLGEGWVAEETLAIAVYAVLSHPGDVKAALRLAVEHSGDSDSTGAVAGNIAGALAGTGGLPSDWLARVELAEVLRQVADDLVDAYAGDLAGLAARWS